MVKLIALFGYNFLHSVIDVASNIILFLDAIASLLPTHVRPSVRHTLSKSPSITVNASLHIQSSVLMTS